MAIEIREYYQVWTMRVSFITTIIVLLLSWINEVRIFNLMVRAGVSFGVMYLLMAGSLSLFERTAPPKPLEDDKPDSEADRGANIDFAIGDDAILSSQVQDAGFPGQIDPNLSSGLPDSKRQAEIVRRMGWD